MNGTNGSCQAAGWKAAKIRLPASSASLPKNSASQLSLMGSSIAGSIRVFTGKDVLIVTYAVRRINRREFRVSQEHRKFGVFAVGELTGLAMPEGYRRSIRACAARRASSRC
jgi:hypothetical protein